MGHEMEWEYLRAIYEAGRRSKQVILNETSEHHF